jgi:hypothetical protein
MSAPGNTAPVISAISPASGTVGTQVSITGEGFVGVTEVRFGPMDCAVQIFPPSSIIATVPAGAATGPVTVTSPGGTASSKDAFTITPGIALSTTPPKPAGTVTMSGAGFGAFEAVDIYFGITKQALASASGTGGFDIPIQVPATAQPSTAYLITAIGQHSALSAQAQLLIANTVTVTNPGGQSTILGTPVQLQIHASDSDGQTLTFTATGMPPGLSLNPTSGIIAGTPANPEHAGGTYEVAVTAQDRTGASGSAQFSWLIEVVG